MRSRLRFLRSSFSQNSFPYECHRLLQRFSSSTQIHFHHKRKWQQHTIKQNMEPGLKNALDTAIWNGSSPIKTTPLRDMKVVKVFQRCIIDSSDSSILAFNQIATILLGSLHEFTPSSCIENPYMKQNWQNELTTIKIEMIFNKVMLLGSINPRLSMTMHLRVYLQGLKVLSCRKQ